MLVSSFLRVLVLLCKIYLLGSATVRATLRKSKRGLSSGNVSYLESVLHFPVGLIFFLFCFGGCSFVCLVIFGFAFFFFLKVWFFAGGVLFCFNGYCQFSLIIVI